MAAAFATYAASLDGGLDDMATQAAPPRESFSEQDEGFRRSPTIVALTCKKRASKHTLFTRARTTQQPNPHTPRLQGGFQNVRQNGPNSVNFRAHLPACDQQKAPNLRNVGCLKIKLSNRVYIRLKIEREPCLPRTIRLACCLSNSEQQ